MPRFLRLPKTAPAPRVGVAEVDPQRAFWFKNALDLVEDQEQVGEVKIETRFQTKGALPRFASGADC